ncbi:hypothetical protein QE152_g13186 [Popillia japonica]|uniref:HAT C-terminal dimerisation domain-containing protein n=1 Tax=Popillia japonica TaxID=7064 RepID=A0AAW1LAY2_POPJA
MPTIKLLMENFILQTTPEEPGFLRITGAMDVNIFDMSTFLDPRFKNKERFMNSLVKTQRYFQNLIELDDHLLEVASNQNPAKKSALDRLYPNEQPQTLNEIDMYVSESVISKNMCPLQWWINNGDKYPRLRAVLHGREL